jgi:carboxylesterase type B
LPVLVFIHGGGFQFGNSDENGADYFMDEDVVLLTLNYRLNSLGKFNSSPLIEYSNSEVAFIL